METPESKNMREEADRLYHEARELDAQADKEAVAPKLEKIKETGAFQKVTWMIKGTTAIEPYAGKYSNNTAGQVEDAIQILGPKGYHDGWEMHGGYDFDERKGDGYRIHLSDHEFYLTFANKEGMVKFIAEFGLKVTSKHLDWCIDSTRKSWENAQKIKDDFTEHGIECSVPRISSVSSTFLLLRNAPP